MSVESQIKPQETNPTLSTSRRKFFVAAAASIPVVAAQAQTAAVAVKPSTIVMKMQGAWGAKDTALPGRCWY